MTQEGGAGLRGGALSLVTWNVAGWRATLRQLERAIDIPLDGSDQKLFGPYPLPCDILCLQEVKLSPEALLPDPRRGPPVGVCGALPFPLCALIAPPGHGAGQVAQKDASWDSFWALQSRLFKRRSQGAAAVSGAGAGNGVATIINSSKLKTLLAITIGQLCPSEPRHNPESYDGGDGRSLITLHSQHEGSGVFALMNLYAPCHNEAALAGENVVRRPHAPSNLDGLALGASGASLTGKERRNIIWFNQYCCQHGIQHGDVSRIRAMCSELLDHGLGDDTPPCRTYRTQWFEQLLTSVSAIQHNMPCVAAGTKSPGVACEAKKKIPLIIAGDLNMTSHHEETCYLFRQVPLLWTMRAAGEVPPDQIPVWLGHVVLQCEVVRRRLYHDRASAGSPRTLAAVMNALYLARCLSLLACFRHPLLVVLLHKVLGPLLALYCRRRLASVWPGQPARCASTTATTRNKVQHQDVSPYPTRRYNGRQTLLGMKKGREGHLSNDLGRSSNAASTSTSTPQNIGPVGDHAAGHASDGPTELAEFDDDTILSLYYLSYGGRYNLPFTRLGASARAPRRTIIDSPAVPVECLLGLGFQTAQRRERADDGMHFPLSTTDKDRAADGAAPLGIRIDNMYRYSSSTSEESFKKEIITVEKALSLLAAVSNDVAEALSDWDNDHGASYDSFYKHFDDIISLVATKATSQAGSDEALCSPHFLKLGRLDQVFTRSVALGRYNFMMNMSSGNLTLSYDAVVLLASLWLGDTHRYDYTGWQEHYDSNPEAGNNPLLDGAVCPIQRLRRLMLGGWWNLDEVIMIKDERPGRPHLLMPPRLAPHTYYSLATAWDYSSNNRKLNRGNKIDYILADTTFGAFHQSEEDRALERAILFNIWPRAPSPSISASRIPILGPSWVNDYVNVMLNNKWLVNGNGCYPSISTLGAQGNSNMPPCTRRQLSFALQPMSAVLKAGSCEQPTPYANQYVVTPPQLSDHIALRAAVRLRATGHEENGHDAWAFLGPVEWPQCSRALHYDPAKSSPQRSAGLPGLSGDGGDACDAVGSSSPTIMDLLLSAPRAARTSSSDDIRRPAFNTKQSNLGPIDSNEVIELESD